jgi:hypothetical protein
MYIYTQMDVDSYRTALWAAIQKERTGEIMKELRTNKETRKGKGYRIWNRVHV